MIADTRITLLAACMMHVEGFYSTKSMAYRGKNPGNIEYPTGLMREFSTVQEGYDFLISDITANKGKPLSIFIAKYAPPNENNTSLYLQIVSTLTGIKPEETI